MLDLSLKLQKVIFDECEKRYPEEACGVVIGRAGDRREAVAVIPCTNRQNEWHARDPKRYPRDAKTAYAIDPKELEQIRKDAQNKGSEMIAIFHSHPEHAVYFSDEDKGMAAPWGEPLFPGISYIVVSVYDEKVKEASDFYWDKGKKDFIERRIK